MLETMKYVRKTFYVDAVRVTEENIEAVANWAEGELRSDSEARYVKVRVPRALNDRQTKAYVGDWVLRAGTGFKVYIDRAFRANFDQHSVETTMQPTKEAVEIVTATEGEVRPVRNRKPTKIVVDAETAAAVESAS